MNDEVLVNGRFLTRSATGVDRFAFELLRAWWPLFGQRKTVSIAMPRGGHEATKVALGMPVQPDGRTGGHLWEQFELPHVRKSSVLVNLCNSAPLQVRRQIVVVHDLAVMTHPLWYSFGYRTWHRTLIAGIMRRAAVVATVSKFSASELSRHFAKRPRDIELISESGEHVLRAPADLSILNKLNLTNRRYVLAVGSNSRNKNLDAVSRAAQLLSDLDVLVVATGGANPRIFTASRPAAQSTVSAGYVSDGELRSLYEHAQCFVFPSFYEGFGLPPLEAMSCGCPVIVSDRASLPEVCGTAALYCDPDDVHDIARQLRRVLSSSTLRSEMREAGLARARGFSWAAAAAQFEQILATATQTAP